MIPIVNTCHRGSSKPNVMPSLNALYSEPPPDEPGDPFEQAPGQPPPEQVLDKYIAAIGGAQRVAALTSLTAKGTYIGFDDVDTVPMEMFARAPGQRTTIVHGLSGDTVNTIDGRNGWIAAPHADKPVPLMTLTGQELEGVKVEAEVFSRRASRRCSHSGARASRPCSMRIARCASREIRQAAL